MSRNSILIAWLGMRNTPADVAIAQMRELRRQVPLLYVLLLVNALAVAYTHYRFAPTMLTVGIPFFLSVVSIVRLLRWVLPGREPEMTAASAIRQLRRTTILAGLLAVAYVGWSLALDQYGGPFEQGHVAIFIAITVIGCIFCLMHLPQAALLVTAIVTVPYLSYYFCRDNPVFIAVALNIALVTLVMIRVLLTSFTGFTRLVQSQGELAARRLEAERLGEENARLAHTDSLTGLPNRRFFFARLEETIRERQGSRQRFAVGVLDLDRFKPVNDTYGHIFGDRLLAELGDRLAAACEDGIVVARLGGDEFGLLITEGADRAAEIGQRFCAIVGQPFQFEEIQLTLGCSCGLAVFPEGGSNAHELFDRSDYALYHVKSRRRGGAALFSLEHETLIRSERAIETALQAADIEREMEVHYQPIVDTTAMSVVSVEALARWTSPTIGPIPPDQFIATAERLGLIHAVTLSLFRKALADAAHLPNGIGLSFNLSANDITSPGTILSLIECIEAGRVSPARITFELTETAVMRDFDAAVASIRQLRALGVKIALDDFGTGYSSLGYLRRLPLDRVKVDRSFASDLNGVSGRNIVTAIYGLCSNLALDCIIEGIESDQQLHEVRALGYRMAQGYLFARPMPLDGLIAWLASGALLDHRGIAPLRVIAAARHAA